MALSRARVVAPVSLITTGNQRTPERPRDVTFTVSSSRVPVRACGNSFVTHACAIVRARTPTNGRSARQALKITVGDRRIWSSVHPPVRPSVPSVRRIVDRGDTVFFNCAALPLARTLARACACSRANQFPLKVRLKPIFSCPAHKLAHLSICLHPRARSILISAPR